MLIVYAHKDTESPANKKFMRIGTLLYVYH